MPNRYLSSFFGRGDDPFRSLFQQVQKTFEDFSRRTPFARFGSDMLSPKIDVAETLQVDLRSLQSYLDIGT